MVAECVRVREESGTLFWTRTLDNIEKSNGDMPRKYFQIGTPKVE